MTTANEQQVEQVLVVPTALFREVGYFQGFTADVEPYMRTLLDPAWTSYQPRDVMEQNPRVSAAREAVGWGGWAHFVN